MHRRRVSSAHLRPRACIITDLRHVKRQGGRCLTILKFFITRYADMQRLTISHPLIAQNNSTNQSLNWLHNPLTCPSTKSDIAQFLPVPSKAKDFNCRKKASDGLELLASWDNFETVNSLMLKFMKKVHCYPVTGKILLC